MMADEFTFPWWTFRIFFFFSAPGRGRGESGATGREGGRFFIENPRRGGGSRKRGWEGPGGCLQGIWAN